ncbi:diaminopimelate epimerase [Lysobacter pythonis]|uniref:Diaminopimelate epimerase n=1 Tax=Solilutibacter pythonis TaxID=2483112 RepID=A0A3M2HSS2_9GAMM|nr:diaminopimelate epimerase [Lysobacter pythonis]RMH92816.1 diaminopimelate epimerase [Lysobacter pythonis]
MHGAGNDFVVLDLRDGRPAPDVALCRLLADRHRGVGCDQILTIEPPRDPRAHVRYGIWNGDGGKAGQCGNGARCVAAWIARADALAASNLVLESPAGLHPAERLADGRWRIGLGRPRFEPAVVPLAGFDHAADSYPLDVDGERIAIGAVSMGNPHALLEVADIAGAEVERLGPLLQRSGYFPDSVNVGFAQVLDRGHVRLRVFERGAGETLACGSGASAAAAILMRRGRLDRRVNVSLPGGELLIEWTDDAAPLSMSGPAAFVFDGVLDADSLGKPIA